MRLKNPFLRLALIAAFSVQIVGCSTSRPPEPPELSPPPELTVQEKAEQGYANAQYNLGQRYEQGNGVVQHYKEAVKWYRKAAEQGDTIAQESLAAMYSSGNGIPKDSIEALKWLSLAATNGDSDAAEKRDFLVMKMSPEEIAEAQKRAREWKPKKGMVK